MRESIKILGFLLGISTILTTCQGRSRLVTAGIFGFGVSDRKDERSPPPSNSIGSSPMNRQPPGQMSDSRRPPFREESRKPPPPPPPPLEVIDSKERDTEKEQRDDERILPPPPFWGGFNPYGPGWMPPPDTAWSAPPQLWQQQQHQQYYPQEGDEINEFQRMQRLLDETLTRESELLGHVQNLTSSLAIFQQREDLHTRQLDVLTERVMDAEAQTASERNTLLENQANCTELGRLIAVLNDEINEWVLKCEKLSAQHESDEFKLAEMIDEVKARNTEVEQFATTIEKARLADERDRYMSERNRKKKQRGFFAWLFGVGGDDGDEDERLQAAQELARTTLLRALQTERDSVHELESVLSNLQQNNSAISEMVESRNELIDELNDRVAVFEEDKLVLKAALRQLQKEMADEAPKTQKLIDDLRSAREQVNKLRNELDSLIVSHQKEVTLLKDIISRNQLALNETESNLKMIGTYVDKLEERLASFAIARRDIEIREEMCNAIEKRSIEVQDECVILQKQAIDFATEYDDIKNLLEDLIKERTRLQNEKGQLHQEKHDLIVEGNNLRTTITSLLVDVTAMEKDINEWKAIASALEIKTCQQSFQLDDYVRKDIERDRAESEALEHGRLGSKKISFELRTAEEVEKVSHETRVEEGAEMDSYVVQVAEGAENVSYELRVAAEDTGKDSYELLTAEGVENVSYVEPPAEDTEKVPYELQTAEELRNVSNKLQVTKEGEESKMVSNELQSAEKSTDEADEEITAQNPLYMALQISDIAPSEITEQGIEPAFLENIHKSMNVSKEEMHSRNVPQDHDLTDFPKLPDIYDKFGNVQGFDGVESEGTVVDSPSAFSPQIHVSQSSLLSPQIIQDPLKRESPPLPATTRTNGGSSLQRRNVPLRNIRKSFSKATGIHGMFTPPSRRRPRRLGSLELMKRTLYQYTSQILRKKK